MKLNLARLAPWLFVLMWSSGAIFVKLGLQDATVISFLWLRALGAFILILAMVETFAGGYVRSLFDLSLTEWGRIAVVGLLLQVAYQVFFFMAIAQGLSPGMLAIILGMQPLLTPIMGREAIGTFRFALLVAGFAGLLLAVLGGHQVGASTPPGLILGLCATLSITAGTLLQRSAKSGVVISVLGQYAVSAVIYFLAILLLGFEAEPTIRFAVSALWMIVVVSAAAILLLVFMLERSAASDVGALFYLVPVITYALDYLVFGDPVSPLTVVGGIIVVGCVYGYRRVAMSQTEI